MLVSQTEVCICMISAHVIAKYFLGDIGEANILCAEDIFYCIGIYLHSQDFRLMLS